MKRYLALTVVGICAAISSASIGSAAARPVPELRKVCSAYAEEHFHDVTAHLPDGIRCIGVGEYCSHGRGFARAYREYGFVCRANGRLAEI
ncbi:MAG TPA: hypothetical protein VMF55_04720 [Solirubrobacterales bacterium]|nr:hypothetical protein [Solirubrobacterales bacterium]